jgi:hypothetical protein
MRIETESDDEIIFLTPNRQLIAKAGRLARAEQERLEQEYRLQDGRRRPKRRTRGVFSSDKRPAGLQEPSPCTNVPAISQIFFGIFPSRFLAGLPSTTLADFCC